MTAAFTFPGQGSQAVGMGKALAEAFPAARAVFDEVDAALSEKLTAIMWDGPAETLQLTENAQPALMAVSMAALRVLESEVGFSVARDAAYVAGHSLGEYSALAAAGSLTIADTARLLRTRGLAMQKAVPVGAGAMAALLGVDYETAVAVAEEAAQGQICQAANLRRVRTRERTGLAAAEKRTACTGFGHDSYSSSPPSASSRGRRGPRSLRSLRSLRSPR